MEERTGGRWRMMSQCKKSDFGEGFISSDNEYYVKN
jgi:hypothetical protein